MRIIDTHMHLNVQDYAGQEDQVVARATSAGVVKMLCVGAEADFASPENAVAMANRFPEVFAAVGYHPHAAATVTETRVLQLRDLARDSRVVAIGEIGLDYFKMQNSKQEQWLAFEKQLSIAEEVGKPVSIHARDAWDDLFAMLSKTPVKGVLHSFTGGVEEARKALDLGFGIAFNGIVTFPKTAALKEAAAFVPADMILFETDAPFLAPQSQRGKKNEPAFIKEVVQQVALLRGVSSEELAEQASQNAERIFKI